MMDKDENKSRTIVLSLKKSDMLDFSKYIRRSPVNKTKRKIINSTDVKMKVRDEKTDDMDGQRSRGQCTT